MYYLYPFESFVVVDHLAVANEKLSAFVWEILAKATPTELVPLVINGNLITSRIFRSNQTSTHSRHRTSINIRSDQTGEDSIIIAQT